MSEHKCGFVYCFRDDTVFVHELQMWRCPEHRKSEEVVRPPASVATLAGEIEATWNLAIETAVAEMVAIFGDRFTATDRKRIRALKRTT